MPTWSQCCQISKSFIAKFHKKISQKQPKLAKTYSRKAKSENKLKALKVTKKFSLSIPWTVKN